MTNIESTINTVFEKSELIDMVNNYIGEPEQLISELKSQLIEKLTEPISKEMVKIKDLILTEYEKGNIVVSTHEGLQVAKLSEIIEQETSGLLYDLNRDAGTILTFIEDPKWVNDYACMKVIVALKEKIKILDAKLLELEKPIECESIKSQHLIHNHQIQWHKTFYLQALPCLESFCLRLT